MIVAKTLSDRVHSCPHCGLVMDRDQNAGVQHYEIGAAVSGITSQDVPDERKGSSHRIRLETCQTLDATGGLTLTLPDMSRKEDVFHEQCKSKEGFA